MQKRALINPSLSNRDRREKRIERVSKAQGQGQGPKLLHSSKANWPTLRRCIRNWLILFSQSLFQSKRAMKAIDKEEDYPSADGESLQTVIQTNKHVMLWKNWEPRLCSGDIDTPQHTTKRASLVPGVLTQALGNEHGKEWASGN